jgi:hypothetical protein
MADLIYKVDGFVSDLEEEGYDIDEILDAFDEYLAITEDIARAASL